MTVNGMTGSNHCFSNSSDSNSRGEKRFTEAANESIVVSDIAGTPQQRLPARKRRSQRILSSCYFFGSAKQFAPLALVLSSQIGRVKYSRFFVPGLSPDSNSDSAASTRSWPCSVAL